MKKITVERKGDKSDLKDCPVGMSNPVYCVNVCVFHSDGKCAFEDKFVPKAALEVVALKYVIDVCRPRTIELRERFVKALTEEALNAIKESEEDSYEEMKKKEMHAASGEDITTIKDRYENFLKDCSMRIGNPSKLDEQENRIIYFKESEDDEHELAYLEMDEARKKKDTAIKKHETDLDLIAHVEFEKIKYIEDVKHRLLTCDYLVNKDTGMIYVGGYVVGENMLQWQSGDRNPHNFKYVEKYYEIVKVEGKRKDGPVDL